MYKETGHAAKALQYCQDVVAGIIPACESVRQACQRQLDDLERDWEYTFDVRKAENACFFIELLPHIKGSKAGTRLILEPWQCFVLCTIFGWVNKDTRMRRFRRVYIEVPKGNGKSALSSGVAFYMLVADGELGAEIYSAATTRDQAKIVFEVALAMARKSPKILEKWGVEVHAHDIAVPENNSVFRTFSSDANSVEGSNPHFVCIDELHAHTTRDLYDNLDTAMGKRQQNLMWCITTAGTDRSGICYEVRGYVLDILKGKCQDDVVFGIVYTIDKTDDWAEEATWKKANPNWGVSVFPADIGQKARVAMQQVSRQPAFKTKHLDIWVNTAHSWMDMRKWDAMGDPKLLVEDFAAWDCIIGMDLASRKDLAAIMRLFWKEVDGVRHYYLFGKYWVPEAAVEQSENSQYAGWSEENRLVSTPGEVNDYNLFTGELKEACSAHNVIEIAHDPYLSDMVVGDMVNAGVPATMTKVTQNVQNFSPAMKELEALIMAGRFHHDGDPLLAWAVSNVEVKPDFKDNIYPRKAKNQDKNKIDPVVATLMALSRALAQTGQTFEFLGVI